MKKLLVLAVLPTMALVACNGISKCSFDEYKEAASKAVEKAPEVDEIIWKGKYDGEKIDFSSKDSIADLSIKENLLRAGLLLIDRVDATYTVENTNATYYKGMGFKVVDGDDKMEYNSKGYLAKVVAKEDGKTYSLTVTHKYAK